MSIYTLFERYYLDTDLAQEYNIMVFENCTDAQLKANKLIDNFKEICEGRGEFTYECNKDKSYIKFDFYDEEGDQWDIIEIRKTEVK